MFFIVLFLILYILNMVAKVCFFIVLPKRTFPYSKLLHTNRKKERKGCATQNASVQGNAPFSFSLLKGVYALKNNNKNQAIVHKNRLDSIIGTQPFIAFAFAAKYFQLDKNRYC
ncbi:hypothetical protein CUB97_04500 [Prevotella intermedia]|uniref:Uncharacterized protein n=1 Tax=Prevotella intermedia TaxID=28131 RepID=A0A2M8M8N9_PREIN|nr:hypothetical protein CUB97_04500 [Prevotella intermedia]